MATTPEAIDQAAVNTPNARAGQVAPLALVGGQGADLASVGVYRFGTFEVDGTLAELRKDGGRVEIQPKVFDLLWYLIERRDRVVSRVEALDTLWSDAVVGEHVLTAAIHEARAALGDSASSQWALKTIPRRGYRFVANVESGAGVVRDEIAPPPRPQPRIAPPGLPPLWGREPEARRFDEAFDAALAGRGGLLAVLGELGMGKSRLLEEYAARAAVADVEILHAWCPDATGVPSLWPWGEMLRAMAESRDDVRLAAELGSAGAAVGTVIPELVSRLSIDLAPSQASPAEERFRLFEGISRFLMNAARHRPLLILLDDLHAADSSTLALLEFVSRQARACPVLIVTASRVVDGNTDPARAASLARLQRESVGGPLLLEGLERPAIGGLVQQVLGREPLGHVIAELERRTLGNPFFVEELARGLRGQEPGEAALEVPSLPAGVRSAIEDKLRDLTASCLEVLRVAALVGNVFHAGRVARACGEAPSEVASQLDEARQHGVLQRHGGRHGIYRFTHGLVRETLAAGPDGFGRVERNLSIGCEAQTVAVGANDGVG